MRRILPILLSLAFYFLLLIAPSKASAVARWGPHLVCYTSNEMMSLVRAEYDKAGTTDWIPATIIITSTDTQETISQILSSAASNKIVPIFRLEGPGFSGLLTADEARKAAQEIAAAVSAGPSFPGRIYVEVGNEPNLWSNWGFGDERIENYNSALSAFLDASSGAPHGVLNAALSLANPTSQGMLDAGEFWTKFPVQTIARIGGTAHNPYDGVGAPQPAIRGTINSWTWERGILSSKGAGGPTFLLEFGYNPLASIGERLAFLQQEYATDRHNVSAITPLFMLHDTNTFKITVFGPNGVSLIDPVGSTGSCGGTGTIPIDTSVAAYFGGDIQIKRKIVGGVPEQLSGITVRPRLEGGSQEIPFPGLSSLASFLSRVLPFQLPARLSQNLTLPNNQLEGAIFHPACQVLGPDGNPIKGVEVGGEGSTAFNTPPFWTNLLGSTKLGQAVSVPGFSSGVSLTAIQPPLPTDEEGNQQLSSCPSPGGVAKQPSPIQASGQTQLFSFNFLDIITSFIKNLAEALLPGVDINVVAKPNKFLPGEAAFSRQTIEKGGMLRSFCPERLCPQASDENDPTPYEVVAAPGQEQDVGIIFKGAAGALEGFELLKSSLLPAR